MKLVIGEGYVDRKWLAVGILITACGSSPSPTMTIDPASATVVQGGNATFTVSGNPQGVRWSIAEGQSGGTIDGGVYTAPRSAGMFHVVAAIDGQPSLSAVVTVPPLSISVVPAKPTIFVGSAERFHAEVNAVGEPVVWSVSSASGGEIDATGLYIAPLVPGTDTVTATLPRTGATSSMPVRAISQLPGGPDLMQPDPSAKVASTVRLHAIWWGDPAGLPAGAEQSIEELFSSLEGSSHLAIADQYMGGAKAHATFAGSLHDPTPPPDVIGDPATVMAEIDRVLKQAGIVDLSDEDMFVVFASSPANSDISKGARCGWHTNMTYNGRPLLIAYVTSPSGSGGLCGVPRDFNDCSSTARGTQLMTEAALHEIFETMTDGWDVLSTWVDVNGEEIADKCGAYLSCVPFGRSVFAVQPEYSNASHGCVTRF
jgi:hypothetical protein